MQEAITGGLAERLAREELRRAVELQAKLIERETNINVKTRMMITYEEQVATLNRTFDLIVKYVDPARRADLLAEVSLMIGGKAAASN